MVLIMTSLNDASANLVMNYLWFNHAICSKRCFIINSENFCVRINDEHGVLFETKENYSAIWINKGFHFHSDIFEELDDKLRFFL